MQKHPYLFDLRHTHTETHAHTHKLTHTHSHTYAHTHTHAHTQTVRTLTMGREIELLRDMTYTGWDEEQSNA